MSVLGERVGFLVGGHGFSGKFDRRYLGELVGAKIMLDLFDH